MDGLSDEELVTLTQGGDVSAFNSLVARWESSLYGFARRTLGDAEDARDVCQEALVKAYVNIRRLRDGAKFKAWVHHIAFNLCRDRFRARRAAGEARPLEDADTADLHPGAERPRPWSPEEAADRASVKGALGTALGRLPEEQRMSILLREYHGFTSEEIGEMTGVPAATVRTRIFYGLRSLRKTLRENGVLESDLR